MKCSEKFSDEDRLAIFQRFYGLSSKNEQDIFLQGLVVILEVKQRRLRPGDKNKPKSKSFKYYSFKGTSKVGICVKAFLNLYAITYKRIRRINNLSSQGKSPNDLRGKMASANTFSEEIRNCVKEHIQSFPTNISHYSGREKYYLNSQLNLRLMHQLYLEKYPNQKVSFSFYRSFFRENFNLSFGRPQVDVCSTCELLNNKIKDRNLNETAKRTAVAELIVHKRRAKKFYSKITRDVKETENKQQVLSLAFDFMQNVQLPTTPVGEVFYYQQLTVSVFCIHNLKTNKCRMYVYHEGQAKKTADEICTFVLGYLNEFKENQSELHLYSDNCWGQNKNHTMIRMLLALTDSGKFSTIWHFFPVRGHSFLPCDRDFALVKKNLRKHDRICTVHEISTIIITSTKNNTKFSVKEVETSDVLDFKKWWGKFYKKTCVSEETKSFPRKDKVNFQISTYSCFKYTSQQKGTIQAYPFIDGLMSHTFKLSQPGTACPTFPTNMAYPLGKVPIKANKMEHIRKCTAFVAEEHKPYFDAILQWPTINIPNE